MEKTKSVKLVNEKVEAKYNLTGFFKLLLEIDMRVNPHLYENIRNTNYTHQSK